MSKSDVRYKIARRIAQELEDGQVVNLGVGIPTLVNEFIEEKEVYLQAENGLLGIGPPPTSHQLDIDLINASKEPVTTTKGASFFSSADSFAMIRGGHVDVAVLGILQVDPRGQIANWAVPNQPILGVGGAMDLVAGAKKVIGAATLFTKDGASKIVKELTYPISGIRTIDLLVTDYAVFSFEDEGIVVDEILVEMSLDELSENIGIPLKWREFIDK
ncbi:3-oxoacid CoA-transferase subunit B [Lysinibacillus sp. SGAir0095]|uniref:3-oxoacid CoA-transferase subunit B n=1 Tax=Lysinibacillus sp. SGAir0095 TaxID=2070463 RepID=UPI0010CD33FD|nr:3-oxoacid CoA-transferase subunit B [Lysinibacillus sp. SGAir0095]QCR32576.1 succinyl-CoA--3-ketoacid-CoA transferase [Lysinibacillus sp. SGAir0095]